MPLLCYFRPMAQLVEQRFPKPQVGGSSPSWPATIFKKVLVKFRAQEAVF